MFLAVLLLLCGDPRGRGWFCHGRSEPRARPRSPLPPPPPLPAVACSLAADFSFWASACLGNVGFPLYMGVWVEFGGGWHAPTPGPETTTAKSELPEPARFSDFCCCQGGASAGCCLLESMSTKGVRIPESTPLDPTWQGNGCLGRSGQGQARPWALVREPPHVSPCPGALPAHLQCFTSASRPRQPSKASPVWVLPRPVGRPALPEPQCTPRGLPPALMGRWKPVMPRACLFPVPPPSSG